MRLGGQIVDLVRLNLLDDAQQARRVRHVAVVQHHLAVLLVRILVQVIYSIGIEERGAALDAVHLISLGEQKFRKIGTVLTRDAGDQRNFH